MTSLPTSIPVAPPIPPPVQPQFVSDLPPISLNERGCIAQDLACRSCGYALRGLPTSGACPECGTAIGRSIHGDLLRFSDPAWVERIARGVRLLVIAFIVSIVGGVLLAVVAAATLAVAGGGGVAGGAAMWAVGIAFVAFLVIVSAMNLVGYWMATTRDPGKDESDKPLTARVIARWAIVAATVISILGLPVSSALPAAFALPGLDPNLRIALQMVMEGGAQSLSIVGMVTLLILAGQLALRLPHDGLARQTRVVRWGYACGAAVMLAGSLITIAAGGNPSNALLLVGGILAVVGFFPMAVFGIWALVLLFRFRSRLRMAAQQARETWARTAG